MSVLLGSCVFPAGRGSGEALWPSLPPEPQELGSRGRAAGVAWAVPVLLSRGWSCMGNTKC